MYLWLKSYTYAKTHGCIQALCIKETRPPQIHEALKPIRSSNLLGWIFKKIIACSPLPSPPPPSTFQAHLLSAYIHWMFALGQRLMSPALQYFTVQLGRQTLVIITQIQTAFINLWNQESHHNTCNPKFLFLPLPPHGASYRLSSPPMRLTAKGGWAKKWTNQ